VGARGRASAPLWTATRSARFVQRFPSLAEIRISDRLSARLPFGGVFSTSGNALRVITLTIALGACVSAPVEPASKSKRWQPAVNDRGLTVEQAQIACRQTITNAGYETIVLVGPLVEVCMRNQGFEF